MSSDTDNLERQAEATRARLADTAESLRAKITPGQMIDEFTSAFRGGDGSIALDNLKTQVRDNPLPLALMGAGFAWLLLGKGAATAPMSKTFTGADHSSAGEPPYGQPPVNTGDQVVTSSSEDSSGIMDKAKSAVSDVYEQGSNALHDAADSVSGTLGAAKEAIGGSGRSAYDSGRSAARGVADQLDGMPRMISDLLEREPLITAAVGVAIGLAIGTVLPHTNIEDEHLGAASDSLKDQAKDLVSDGLEQTKAVAAESFEALKDAADEGGLTPGDTPLAERLGSVVKAAATAGETAIKDRLSVERN